MLLPLPPPLFRQQIASLSQSSYVSPGELSDRRGGGGAKLYDDEKVLFSINHLILSATNSSILKYEQFSCELTCCLQKLLLAEFTQRFHQFCVVFPHCFECFLYGTSAVLES
jgi:hypothetical protein